MILTAAVRKLVLPAVLLSSTITALAWDDSGSQADSSFPPVGLSAAGFKGNSDGGGRVIANLYINAPTTEKMGLFSFIQGFLLLDK